MLFGGDKNLLDVGNDIPAGKMMVDKISNRVLMQFLARRSVKPLYVGQIA